EEAQRRLSEARSTDGDMEHLWGAFELASTSTLKGLGAISAQDKVELTVKFPDRTIAKVLVETSGKLPERRIDKLVAPPGMAPPLFLRAPGPNFWHEPLPAL